MYKDKFYLFTWKMKIIFTFEGVQYIILTR